MWLIFSQYIFFSKNWEWERGKQNNKIKKKEKEKKMSIESFLVFLD
jgi:hypothetical protein